MADNKLYVTAGLVPFDSYLPSAGDNKFYVTAGLIPSDLIPKFFDTVKVAIESIKPKVDVIAENPKITVIV